MTEITARSVNAFCRYFNDYFRNAAKGQGWRATVQQQCLFDVTRNIDRFTIRTRAAFVMLMHSWKAIFRFTRTAGLTWFTRLHVHNFIEHQRFTNINWRKDICCTTRWGISCQGAKIWKRTNSEKLIEDNRSSNVLATGTSSASHSSAITQFRAELSLFFIEIRCGKTRRNR